MNILDLFGGDVTKLMSASEIALRKTEFGRAGIVSHELDPSGTMLKFRNRATGTLYDNIEDAFREASAMNITQFERIVPGRGLIGGVENNPRRAQMGIILQSMQDAFNQKKSGGDAQFLDFLTRSGITEDDLSFRILGSQSTRGKKSADFLKSVQGKLGGYISFADDEGIDLLQLSVGGKTLSTKEMHLLMSHLGNDIFDTAKLAKVFGANGTSSDIEEYLSKIGKRVRGYMSDRDITFALQDVREFLGYTTKYNEIPTSDLYDDFGVIIEEGLDIFKKHFDIQARGKVLRTKGGKSVTHISQIMENVDSQSIIESGIRAIDPTKSVDEVMASFDAKGGIRDLIESSTSNSELLSAAKARFGEKSDEYKMFASIMDTAEKEFDGTAVLNKKLIQGAKDRIRGEISRVESEIASGTGDTNLLRYQLTQLKQQRDILNNATNLEQITGRGQVGEYGIKTAFEISNMRRFGPEGLNDFENVAFIIGRSGLKNDTNLAGSAQMISLSGLGTPRDLVYADPVSVAFHPEVFASEAELNNIKAYQGEVMSDFRQAVEENNLPKNIRNMLKKTIEEDVSALPQPMQLSRLRNQEFARQILQLHQSGIGPRESPIMMNMLHSLYASEMYTVRTKVTAAGDVTNLFMPVTPNTTRLAIGSETSAAMMGLEPILGNYKSAATGRAGHASIQLTANAADTADLLKFRVNNHKMLLHAGAVKEYYNALGGFDLDDKGLPKLLAASYKDASGKTVRNLMFGIIRQPSAIEEIAYGSATLNDVETLRHFFGVKNDSRGAKSFLTTLEEMKSGDDVMEDLYRVLSTHNKQDLGRTEDEIQEAIFKVYDRLSSEGKATLTIADDRTIDNLLKHGSSSLRFSDEATREGIYRVKQAELEEAISKGWTTQEKSQRTFIRKEIKKLLPDYEKELDPSLYNELLNITSEKDLREFVSRNSVEISPGNVEMPAGLKALLSHAGENFMKEVSTRGDSDILGVYINRSMAVGSTLNQMEDFAKMLDTSDLDLLRQFQIGLGTQEFAIDRAVNFTAERKFIATVSEAVANNGLVSAEALRKLHGGTTVGQVGEEAILNMGRRLGVGTAIYENALATGKYAGSMTEELKPVIDRLILSGRLTESNDIPNLIKGIIQGIESTGYTTDATTAMLEKLGTFKEGGDKAVEYLMQQFGANGSHKYASLAKMDEVARTTAAEIDALRRLSLAGIPQDQVLASTQMSDEAEKIASFLLDSHKEDMDRILTRQSGELDDTFRYMQSIQKMAMGEQVAQDIKNAAEMAGLSQEEILNAMEIVSARKGQAFRYAELDTLSDEGLEFVRKLGIARNKRTIDFYRKTSDPTRMGILEDAAKILRDETSDRGAKSLSEAIAAGTSLAASLTEAESLAVNEYNATADAVASEESRVIRALSENERLKAEQAALMAEMEARGAGTIAAGTADLEDDFAKGISSALSGEDYSSLLGSNTTFKRMKEFVQSGELGELFANNKIFKNSVMTAGALIAGSFLYSAFKDHTSDDIKGPPLLPGGSAYEDQYPNRLPEIPQIGTVNYNPGVSYKVNLYGGYDNVESFRSAAMGLGNFDMNTTMYNKIPDVGKDPYAEIASSY